MLNGRLVLVEFELKLGLLPLKLFFIEIVLLLKFDDLFFQRLHLEPQLLDTVQHLDFILSHVVVSMSLQLNGL